MTEQLTLVTDYFDFYDHAFSRVLSAKRWADAVRALGAAPGWWRWAEGTRHRHEDHDELEHVGLKVPRRGLVGRLSGRVVVYLDPTSHRGEGKARDQAERWAERDHGLYAIQWVGPPEGGESWRLLLVGSKLFLLRYHSATDWRSNHGEVQITQHALSPAAMKLGESVRRLPYPLVAVDFVSDGGELWAVDLNTAPGLRGTPVQELMRPDAVAREITERWKALKEGRL